MATRKTASASPRTPSPSAKRPASPTAKPANGFAYSQDEFKALIEQTLDLARKMGASDAGAEVS